MLGIKLKPSISVIIPALDEEAIIERTVRESLDTLGEYANDFEILLINDGSKDATGALMESLAKEHPKIRVFHNKTNRGFGASFMRGVGEARCENVMLICGDEKHPQPRLRELLKHTGEAEIIVGHVINLRELKTPFRYAISRLCTHFLNTLFGMRLQYYCGSAVFPLKILTSIPIVSTGFAFQAEILIKLIKSGHSYKEVGHRFDPKVRSKRSRVFTWKNLSSVTKTIFSLMLWLRQKPQSVYQESLEKRVDER